MKITDENYSYVKQLLQEYELKKQLEGRFCSICSKKAAHFHILPGSIPVYRCEDHYPEPYPYLSPL
jgi:hypothetical protein